ncbi:MAG TPA: hypothetical protein VE623_07220 [Acidimicrobiales bacterium]|nr:hypothetical protein [Acidimicrobiales bacterium]
MFAVAAGDPQIAAVVAQIPFNRFPKRKETRQESGAASQFKLAAAILWDALRAKLRLKPFYIPWSEGPVSSRVAASKDPKRLVEILTGGDQSTLWKNQVAPRALLKMARFKPYEYAPKVQAPVLVCAARDDLAPMEITRELADLAPRGELRVFRLS